MATSNEHFNAKDIDKQVEQALAQARPNEPNTQLVADLQRLHQADAQADAQSLNYAWQHIRARNRSQRSLNNEGKVIPMHIPLSHMPDKTQDVPRQQRFASTRRAFTLIAAVLVAALVVGSLLTVLYRARTAQEGNPGSPHATVIPKATNQPTQVHPGQVVYNYKVKDSIIMGLQWSPDGKRIVLVGNDAHIWDATTGKNEVTYHPTGGGRAPIQNVAWAPDGSQRLAVATNTVQIIDANTGKALVIGPNQSTAHIGNLLTSLLSPLTPHSAGSASITGLAWSPDGKYIASSLNDPTSESQNPQDHPILIWDSKTGAVVKTLIGHTADAYHVAWSPDGKYLASFSQNWDETVRVWNAKTGSLINTVHAKGYGSMGGIAWSPNSQYLAVSMDVQVGNNTVGEIKTKPQVQVWQALTGTPIMTLSPTVSGQYLAWSHDGKRIAMVESGLQTIASGPDEGNQISIEKVEIWNPMNGQTIYTYQEKSGEMRGVTWSPDDTLIATASMNSSSLPPDKKTQNDMVYVHMWATPAK